MRIRSLRGTTWLLLAAGVAVVAAWIALAGGSALLATLGRLRPATGLLLLFITCLCVFLRFLRWQYLCRRVGIRVPTRRSLAIYLASLAGIATPAYVGEAVRCVFLRREFGVPVRRTLPLWVTERVLDFASIGVLTAAGASGSVLTFLLVVAGAGSLLLGGELILTRYRDAGWANRAAIVLPVFGLTLVAWLPAMLAVTLAARGLGFEIGMLDGVRIFGSATLGGGLSLLPAGMVAMGGLAIVQLEGIGLALADAVATVSVVRLATAGITLAIGGVFLMRELRVPGEPNRRAVHFDAIADEYLHQFPPHIWNLLLARKTATIAEALGPPSSLPGVGLDLGCGLGLQADALRTLGYRVVGLDPAVRLLQRAGAGTTEHTGDSRLRAVTSTGGRPAVAGSALALPFADASLDFIYTVGVLHHLADEASQRAACAEVARVLRPDGVFIVHETNPNNPLFRLYMSYLFPVLRSIDEGIERWIPAERWVDMPDLRLAEVRYFTFLPDFLPRLLLHLALPIERWLERGPLRRYSVHYMAVLRRSRTSPDGVPTGAAAASRGQA